MSQTLIRKALETRLAAMPALATAYEGVDFTPVVGTPYQKAFLLPAAPDNSTQGASYYRELGVFQVTLCYPKGTGANAAQTRAELIKTQFKRATTMIESSLRVVVTNTPTISPGFIDGDRYCVPVSIYYQTDIFI